MFCYVCIVNWGQICVVCYFTKTIVDFLSENDLLRIHLISYNTFFQQFHTAVRGPTTLYSKFIAPNSSVVLNFSCLKSLKWALLRTGRFCACIFKCLQWMYRYGYGVFYGVSHRGSFCYVTKGAESEQPLGAPFYQWVSCRDDAGLVCFPHSGSW